MRQRFPDLTCLKSIWLIYVNHSSTDDSHVRQTRRTATSVRPLYSWNICSSSLTHVLLFIVDSYVQISRCLSSPDPRTTGTDRFHHDRVRHVGAFSGNDVIVASCTSASDVLARRIHLFLPPCIKSATLSRNMQRDFRRTRMLRALAQPSCP
jgi:hypothetical protein